MAPALDGPGASVVTSHPFNPRGEPWERCDDCGLSEAAHVDSLVADEIDARLRALPYRCPDCVTARDFGKAAPHLPGECPR